jgi:hypothetical protein
LDARHFHFFSFLGFRVRVRIRTFFFVSHDVLKLLSDGYFYFWSRITEVLVSAIDQGHFEITLSSEGKALYRLRMRVRNTQRQYLRATLPPNFTIWYVTVAHLFLELSLSLYSLQIENVHFGFITFVQDDGCGKQAVKAGNGLGGQSYDSLN